MHGSCVYLIDYTTLSCNFPDLCGKQTKLKNGRDLITKLEEEIALEFLTLTAKQVNKHVDDVCIYYLCMTVSYSDIKRPKIKQVNVVQLHGNISF